jgi:hypothetical protein
MDRILTLAEYLTKKLVENDTNPRRVAENSEGAISATTIYDLSNDRGGSPSVETLKGIVKGFRKPEIEEELFRVARGLPTDPENAPYNEPEYLLLMRFRSLNKKDKAEILELMGFKFLQYSKGGDKTVTDEEIQQVVSSTPPIKK